MPGEERIALVVGVICILLGTVPAGVFVHAIGTTSEIAKWMEAPGIILSSECAPAFMRESDYGSYLLYHARISYEYEVLGQTHRGRSIAYGRPTKLSLGQAKTYMERYPTGKQVTVYYNPENPSETVLEQGTQLRVYAYAGAAMIFFGIGLACVGVWFFDSNWLLKRHIKQIKRAIRSRS